MNFFIFFLISFAFYLLSIVIIKNDPFFSYRWLAFTVWVISVLILPLEFLWIKTSKKLKERETIKIDKAELAPFGLILLLVTLSSFIFLTQYPFVSVYDQVRDGGLNTMEIVNGTIKNVFGYGRYASHGLIIPIITSFFYLIFKNTVLTFRILTAIISILDVMIIYVVIRKTINKEAAFWSSLILLSLPLHLYYARTEIVPFFSSIFTSLIFLFLSVFLKNKGFLTFSLLGLLLGFSSGFHTSIRTVAVLTLIIIIFTTFYEVHRGVLKKKFALGLIFMIFFYFIGFGPRILFTTPDIFSQTRSTYPGGSLVENISGNYKQSLLVYFKEPTLSTHYPDFKPILDPVLGIFFVLGFLLSIFAKNKFLKYVCLYAIFIPFLNSAITDTVNADHRLLPLLPITAVLAGFGIYSVTAKAKNILRIKNWQILPLGFLLLTYILYQGFNFFWNEPATKQYGTADYLSMHTIYFINLKEDYKNLNGICLFVSSNTYRYFNLLHVQEQYQYFVPNKYIRIIEEQEIPENEIYISKSCDPSLITANFVNNVFCSDSQKFICPKNGHLIISSETKAEDKKINIFNEDLFLKPSLLIEPTVKFIP